MAENYTRLSKNKRRCVRQILSRVRKATQTRSNFKSRSELRKAVVNDLLGGEKAEAIIRARMPKPVRNAPKQEFCRVCNRNTKHRGGQCQEHEVKYCDKCKEMTPRTANDKCTKHVVTWCRECRFDRAFVNGKCVESHLHPPPDPPRNSSRSIWSTFWGSGQY
ncbi:MAG: hypothetical protein PHW33_02705 [Candidatus Portnoybacteria bacterium]|nr:hypothetical protein [Candidatus Portnoybacteria bacterium]MDD5437636.1 hypothetical protein [Patescibacteria group bacterium]